MLPPKRPYGTDADFSHPIAAGFGATTLSTVSGKPVFAPQSVEFKNSGVANQNAVYTDAKGVVHTVPLNPGQVYPTDAPVASINTSGADVSCICYWWYAASGAAINA